MKKPNSAFFPAGLLLLVATSQASTIVIDGVNDFTAADTHPTSTSGQSAYAAYDNTNLYLGYSATAIASGSSFTWYLAYLGTGMSGSTSGVVFNTQQPLLPFAASHLVRWRADGFQDVLEWTGAAWGASSVAASFAQSGNYLELAVPLAQIGSPPEVELVAYMLHDQAFNEWSHGAAPANAFADGYDPDFSDSIQIPEPSIFHLCMGLAGVALCRRRRNIARAGD